MRTQTKQSGGHTTGRDHRAFTLIELLIVVAIIAILAAIAVPNFLEAQVRAKVSSVKAGFRTIKTGLESYWVDYSKYPDHVPAGQYGDYDWYVKLTTPIAYLTSVPESPFPEWNSNSNTPAEKMAQRRSYEYWPTAGTAGYNKYFAIVSVGPNGLSDYYDNNFIAVSLDLEERMDPGFVNGLYDATNGTKSFGDLVVTNKKIH